MTKNDNKHFSKLDSRHPLFQSLSANPPWWQLLKEQEDCYIDIRKNNTINVYCNGGSLMRISYPGNCYKIEIHDSYLQGRDDILNIEKLNIEKINFLKGNICKRFPYHSESGIKAQLVCASDSLFFDSEFAFTTFDSESASYKIIRIDLVRAKNRCIEFVELKRIGDSRLLNSSSYNKASIHKKRKKEEIIEQIEAYKEFVHKNANEIKAYYTKLWKIKKELKLLPTQLMQEDITQYEIAKNIILFIDMEDYNESQSKRRKDRRNTLKSILESNKVCYETNFPTGL